MRLMTMHGAKGLEFPIVVLANLGGAGGNSKEPVPDEAKNQLHFDVGSENRRISLPDARLRGSLGEGEEALALEDIRLLYVAATRARDHLLIPDFQGKRKPGPLLGALAPLLPEREGHEQEIDDVWMLDAGQVGAAHARRGRPAHREGRGGRTALADREAWQGAQEGLIKEARQGLELRSPQASSGACDPSLQRPRIQTPRCWSARARHSRSATRSTR